MVLFFGDDSKERKLAIGAMGFGLMSGDGVCTQTRIYVQTHERTHERAYLRDGGKEVVGNLVVERAAEEGGEPVPVRIVHRGLDLFDLVGSRVSCRLSCRVVGKGGTGTTEPTTKKLIQRRMPCEHRDRRSR